jgi:superfamily II DNA/RNA helicase
LEKVEYSTSKKRRYASNILLATNMISVGIDIARLNVMLLVGQPKLTSEYIQASSRVGRSYPGVAFVQFDATKSRDRSHYEGFKAYHGSFYRFVEPTGATPFSKPARERALHAIVTSILRHRAGFSEDKDAGNFDEDYYAGIVSETQRFIVERLEQMNLRSHSGAETGTDDVREEIQTFVSWWHRKAKSAAKSERPLYFGRRFMVKPPGDEVERLFRQYGSSGHDNSLETLSSMRNVDTQVEGKILIWEG